MATYALGVTTISTTNGTAALELFTCPTCSCRVLEMSVLLLAATASTFGVGRPAAQGVKPAGTNFVQEGNTADLVGRTQAAVGWTTTPPTAPAAYMRQASIGGTIGNGIIWTFPRGLFVPISASIVLWNLATNSTAYVSICIDE